MLNKLIKFFIVLTLILMLIAFTACEQPAPTELSETWEDQYTEVLEDADIPPEQIVIDSRQYDLAVVYNDNTLTDEEKVALMMKQATLNETLAYRYAYFINKQGTTTLSDNFGTLIYQRTRRQNLNAKYDVTLKLPVNHNFSSIAQTFVTSSTIRLVTNGKYYRMEGDNSVLGENGILAASGWKKKSGKFDVDEDMINSQNYSDAQKSAINYDCVGIIAEGAIVKLIESETGNYYRLTFTADTAVANSDSTTMSKLEEDNGGSDMSYNSFSAVVEIWASGFMKTYKADESWQGNIAIYNGSAQSRIVIYYSYSERDNDMSVGIATKDGLM